MSGWAIAPDGTRVAFQDWGGGGRPLVLLPGIGGNLQTMASLAARTGRRCVGVEVRGTGQSDRPTRITWEAMVGDIAAVVDELDLGEVDVVGHSLGGMLGASFCATAPGSRLVSIDGFPPGQLRHAEATERTAFARWTDNVRAQLDTMTAGPSSGDSEWMACERTAVRAALRRLGYSNTDVDLVADRQFRIATDGRWHRSPTRAVVDAVFEGSEREVLADYRASTAPTCLLICLGWAPPPLLHEIEHFVGVERPEVVALRLPIGHIAPICDAVDTTARAITEFLEQAEVVRPCDS